MIKKISAVLLALTLCFSVMVLPATALSGEEKIGYRIELDKDTYAAGEPVTVSLYLDVDDDTELHTGTLLIGINSAAFDVTTNAADTVKATATGNDTFTSFYNDPSGVLWAYLADKVVTQVQGSNTAAENELYDKYIKISITRNLSGSHANAADNKHGLPGSDINADADPFLQFTLTLKDSLADGAAVNVGITSGSIAKTQTAFKAFTNPGNATTTANLTAAQTNLDASADTAVIGTAASLAVAKYKAQLKMTPTSATTVADDFSFRVQSVITDADWDAYVANTGDNSATTSAIQSMGIVAYKGAGTFDEATAKALVIDGTAATDYACAETDYVQKTSDTADAYFGAIIKAKHSTMTNDVTYMGYVRYLDAAGTAQVAFYEAAQTAALASNYDTYVSQYLAANPYQA